MNDEELAERIADSVGGLPWIDAPVQHPRAAFKDRVVSLLTESRRQRLDGVEGRLVEISAKKVPDEKGLSPGGQRQLFHSDDRDYLLQLVADLRLMIHDLQEDRLAYQLGKQDGAAEEREACAQLVNQFAQEARRDKLACATYLLVARDNIRNRSGAST